VPTPTAPVLPGIHFGAAADDDDEDEPEPPR
jgi:hypothetical protein